MISIGRDRQTVRMLAADPNWAEQVTAVATAVLAIGVLGAGVAAVFAGQQVREARRTRQAHTAADFFRRWNEEGLTEARRLAAAVGGPAELATAFSRYGATNA